MFYWDHRQFSPESLVSIVLRPEGQLMAATVEALRNELRALDPGVAFYSVRRMDELFADQVRRSRLATRSLAALALIALLLAGVGTYGVISYIVSQRTREIGVRMALGADRRDVRRMVLRQGMILAGLGVVIGLVAAMGLTRLMSSLLYGVEATDPVTFGVVAVLLTAVALVASYLPALRASRTDPLEAIRFE